MKEPDTCFHCGAPLPKPVKIKKTFLLFKRTECGKCGVPTCFPASTGVRILHWSLALTFTALFIAVFRNGGLLVPGALFIAGYWGIIADWWFRRAFKRKGVKIP